MRGYTGESVNYNTFDKRCKRTCNEITKYMIEGTWSVRGGEGKYLVATAAAGFSQIVQSHRSKWNSPRDHKTDDCALKWGLIASHPLEKHIVGKLCFPCWFAIRFFEIYGSETTSLNNFSRISVHTWPLEISCAQTLSLWYLSVLFEGSLHPYWIIRPLSIWYLPQKRPDEVVEPSKKSIIGENRRIRKNSVTNLYISIRTTRNSKSSLRRKCLCII